MCQKQYDFLKHQKILVPFMIVAFILTTFVPSVTAEEKPAESGWKFQVAPYLWAISMKGNVTVKGLEADADVGFKDIWDELNFAVMLAYEARKKHWGLWGNTIYAHLGDSDVEGPLGLTKVDPTVNALWQGLGATYRLGTWNLAHNSDKKTVSGWQFDTRPVEYRVGGAIIRPECQPPPPVALGG